MMLNEITQAAGARQRRKRVGRGESSGKGRTCGRGNKGAQARAGYSVKRLFEGGQKALYSRFPKRGFNNFNFRVEYEVVNIGDLEAGFDSGAKIDAAALAAHRLISGPDACVKILGSGEIKKKLAVTVHGISETAKQAIEKAGGSVTVIPRRDSAALAKAKRRTMKGKKRAASPTRLEKKKAAAAAK